MGDLLKFITCGSVDDGKSTLIGHILYDSKLLYADQEKALELDSKVGSRGGAIDYSLLLDGLTEEREQGITIDVAYRYFTTDRRSFIVADTPGHEEYTRNMAVGASFADLAVILVDAEHGVLVQTRRHARICALMGIRYFVFAVNKMDLVGYSEKRFLEIKKQIEELSSELNLEHVTLIPVSATEGDNVTKRSEKMPWYTGDVLLDFLETVNVDDGLEEKGFTLPVQRVCRPSHEFRGFQGQVESGTISVGDEITSLPSEEKAHIKSILIGDKEAVTAQKGQPVTVTLDREIDTSRGSVLCREADLKTADSLTATILWMDDAVLDNGKNFFVKLGTRMIPGLVTKILYKIDVNTGEHKKAETLNKNELAVAQIALTDKIVADEFRRHRTLGELILIDRISFQTSACGVVNRVEQSGKVTSEGKVTPELRAALEGQKPVTVEFRLGRNGVDRALAEKVEKGLVVAGRHTYLYQPEAGEPVKEIVTHLNQAGIVVLLLLGEDVESPKVLRENASYIDDWGDTEISVDSVVHYIYQVSSFDGDTSHDRDNI